MSESKWKQIVGKKISESAYVSPQGLREEYNRAMTKTTFTKVVSEDETELRMMEKVLQAFGLGDKYRIRRKEVERLKKAPLSLIEQKKIADEILKERGEQENNKQSTQTNGGCRDGEYCQRIVTEQELGGLLAHGWRVVCPLPSGKIVVSNEA